MFAKPQSSVRNYANAEASPTYACTTLPKHVVHHIQH